MLGAASALTLVTLTGLAAGFAREWLLVAGWGAGGRTDAMLVAMFLPEALRMILSGGLLSSAALALWNTRSANERPAWLGSTTTSLVLVAIGLALLLCIGAPLWVRLVGPGLSSAQRAGGAEALRLLAWALPGIVLQAWWSVPLQAHGQFVRAGFGSLLFNLPAIAYMSATRHDATETGLGLSFIIGSLLMTLPLVGPVMKLGLGRMLMRPALAPLIELGRKLLPLAASALTGQGLMLLERIVASFLGEGSVTVLNLARKLVNLPLVALGSLNQVLLGLMSRQVGGERLALLGRGLATVTTFSLPVALALVIASAAVVALLFGGIPGHDRIQPLLAWYAVTVVFAGWNAMIARFSYAAGDAHTPLVCELSGSALQTVLLPLLAWRMGTSGIAVAMLCGTLLTGHLLMRRDRLWGRLGMEPQVLATVALLMCAGVAMPALLHRTAGTQLWIAALASAAALALLGFWLQPWRTEAGLGAAPMRRGPL